VRALVPVAVVAIIAVTVLLLVWTDRRRKVRTAILNDTLDRAAFAEQAIAKIRQEIRLQEQASVADLEQLRYIIADYDMSVHDLAIPTTTILRRNTR
jgi:hypothetical protein